MTHYGLGVQGERSPPSWAIIWELWVRISRGWISLHTIKSSVAARRKLDVLPVNLDDNANNHAGINDPYIEFRLPGIPGQFLDLSTLSLELQVSVAKADGAPLDADDHVVFSNGLNNTMFKSCACYLNEQLVESSSLFNYHVFIKNDYNNPSG